MNNIPYTKQTIEEDDKQALLDTLESNWITRGPTVQAFEKAVSDYCKVPYAVAFNSGSVALEAACYAGELNAQDHLFSSPNTFVGTVSGAVKRSQNLHFLDLDIETGSPNFNHLQQLKVEGRVCLIPVHFSGIAKKIEKPFENSLIIEDACQAFGARYPTGERVGGCPTSDMTVFSFHPAKTICMGEGGLVTTKDEEYYKRLLLFRNNGIIKKKEDDPWYYEIVDLTNNYNVTDISASLGLSQLKKVDLFLEHRRKLVQRYREQLGELKHISLFSEKYDAHSSHNLFVTQIDFEAYGTTRKEVMLKLREEGIGTQVHFIPLYKHPYFKTHFSFKEEAFPCTESYYERALSLPLFSHLSFEEVDRVCASLAQCLNSKSVCSYL